MVGTASGKVLVLHHFLGMCLSSHREADPWQKADSCRQTESEPGNHENYFYRKEGP